MHFESLVNVSTQEISRKCSSTAEYISTIFNVFFLPNATVHVSLEDTNTENIRKWKTTEKHFVKGENLHLCI